MRYSLFLLLSLTLAGCGLVNNGNQPVDPAKLPPLTGQERALLISAETAARSGDVPTAERNYQTAIAQSKGHVEAHLSLADLYIGQNQEDKAAQVLEKAAEFQPTHPEVNRMLGKIAINNNEPGKALQHFNAGLKRDAANFDLLNGAGISNDLLHHHGAAQLFYLKAIQLRPNDDVAMVKTNLAMSYLLDSKAQKAVDLLKSEIKKPGTPVAMRHNLALAYGVLGRHAQARTLLNGEISEEERQQSLKRLADHIAAEVKERPSVHKNDKPPMPVSKPQLQPKVQTKP